MLIDAINQALEEKKVEPEKITNYGEQGIIYLYKCLYDNEPANMIDFTRFSLSEIEDAMEYLENGYNEETDSYVFDNSHKYGIARNYSDFEYNLANMFSDIASKRRRSIRKFV